MSRTGIVIEMENGAVKETSLGVMTAAAGREVFALVLEDDASAAREKLAEFGAGTIVSVTGDFAPSPDQQAQAIAAVVQAYHLETLLGTASANGKDLFARVAAILDEPLASDCIDVNIQERVVKKSHFSGKTLATIKVKGSVLLCTIRPNSIEPSTAPAEGKIEEFPFKAAGPDLTRIKQVIEKSDDRLDLTEASIIITGGRAIKSADNYAILDACAKKLGAAVGASRAAVDAEYAPHTMQVGQTGKTVSPKLYIACGVSGAVQHFAGMKTSKVIVAINTDKDAPIFSKCDYGIVGDMFDVVPALTEKL